MLDKRPKRPPTPGRPTTANTIQWRGLRHHHSGGDFKQEPQGPISGGYSDPLAASSPAQDAAPGLHPPETQGPAQAPEDKPGRVPYLASLITARKKATMQKDIDRALGLMEHLRKKQAWVREVLLAKKVDIDTYPALLRGLEQFEADVTQYILWGSDAHFEYDGVWSYYIPLVADIRETHLLLVARAKKLERALRCLDQY